MRPANVDLPTVGMVSGTGTATAVVHPLLLFVSIDYERVLVHGVGYLVLG